MTDQFISHSTLTVLTPASVLELVSVYYLHEVDPDTSCANCYFNPLGTPEVGGLTVMQGLEVVRGCKGLNIIGADVVEVLQINDYCLLVD